MSFLTEKPAVEPVVTSRNNSTTEDHSLSNTAAVDVLEVTHKLPYGEINFIGTYFAVGLGAASVYGGFVMPATSLALINADIGPSANVVWVPMAWTLCLAVGYTLVGRFSDLFGRRWFFIGSSLLATIGCAIGGSAKGINQLIGANVLIGLAAAVQLSFQYILTELVPMKHRFYVLAMVFIFALPLSAFGPVISRILIVHTKLGWRWDFYMNLILNGASTLLYFLFYFPPNFNKLHARRKSRWQEIQDLDLGGIFLYSGGLLLFMMGLSWGGGVYPWGSARVIATIVVGGIMLVIFVFYEIYMPLNRPLVPMHLFSGRAYNVLTVASAVGGMLYYSMNVLFPTMVVTLFTTDIIRSGLLSCAVGGGVAAGQFSSSLWAKPGGHFRWKLFFSVFACTVFTAAMAGAKTEATATALIVVASFFVGALESLAGVAVTLVIPDQTEIGVAIGVYGSIRSAAGTLAVSIFSTILMDQVKHNTIHDVVPELVQAGLPLTSVEPFLTALATGEQAVIAQVPGVTAKIIGVAVVAMKAAYSNAFTVLYYVTLAFGGISTICAFWAPEIEHLYTDEVMRRLDRHQRDPPANTDKEAAVEQRELA